MTHRNYTLNYKVITPYYIGYTYVIHHTYHTFGNLIPNVWYVLYSLYGSLFTPHVVLPKWGNRSTFAPRK